MSHIQIEEARYHQMIKEIEELQSRLQYEKDCFYKLSQETDVEKLRKKAIKLAHILLNEYLTAICKNIGFDDLRLDIDWAISHSEKPENWYMAEDLKIKLSANISDAFKMAYINIGLSEKALQPKHVDLEP